MAMDVFDSKISGMSNLFCCTPHVELGNPIIPTKPGNKGIKRGTRRILKLQPTKGLQNGLSKWHFHEPPAVLCIGRDSTTFSGDSFY
jgi:hypothetical protein